MYKPPIESGQMESGLHGALYFEIFENHVLKFPKTSKNNSGCGQCCIVPRVTSRLEISCFAGCTFEISEVQNFNSSKSVRFCYLCVARNIDYFDLRYCTLVEYTIAYI